MTKTPRAHRARIPGSVRLTALVLTALTLCAFLAVRPVRAAEWMTPYLEQVQEWGVMRGDSQGNLHEDRNITRAEFVTLVNRAFGYEEPSPSNPFTDVNPNDWFAEDVSIAHQAGYFNGTSDSTASPYSLVTREQAAVFLGRCLRFQGVPNAANSTFTDMHEIGGWSRPLVQEAAELGIIQGYADGSFRPNLPITRGQMACFLVRALGTLVQEPGEQTSGGVYGNLTITTPGVKLKDTTVTGNLYLTGGVGLGNVELENVNVMGKIIICGGGEAEAGKQSVLLRNVTAGALELDSLTEQFLSIQAEGLTNIGEVTLRTPGYLEDRTEDGLGFQTIRLDGVEGSLFQLAGNIKRVVNLTPESTLQLAQGVADVITMDEKAVDAKLTIDDRASIRELNLDRGTDVDGKGSIGHLNINAPDSNVTMLPDTIYIRPGITGNVYNQDMDNIAAAESSEDPRLLAGYPKAKNIAPTSASAVFSTNKPGTIHWAITALMDGSLGEEELMNPGSHPKILRSGTLKATASNTEFTARLTGLTKQGSYYISALLEDARGRRSPVKIAAFTTPDDTAPNFVSGYPQTPILTVDADNEQVAQIMVMANKDCQMYYVLLPKGAAAPTPADFRSAALPGNLGYGIVDLKKNTPFLVSRINTSHLQEQTQYDLYLWLNDADNGKSSAVKKVTFTTKDMTPPTIQFLRTKVIAARQVTMEFALDEPGMLYWAVVKQGAAFYGSGIDKDNPGLAGQIQIENGTGSNVVRRGGPVRAARAGTGYNFAISGLEPQTAYDLYYVAKDLAGNYCVYTKELTPPMTINTLDNEPPTVKQTFTNEPEGSPETRPTPYPTSTVNLVFSEVVLAARNENGEDFFDSFEEAYNNAQGGSEEYAKIFADLLRKHIKLYRQPARGTPVLVSERTAENASTIGSDWVIDYRFATVSRDRTGTGEMTISFPCKDNDKGASAINLGSGQSYFFIVSDIADNSDAHNRMKHNVQTPSEGYKLPVFTTVDAQLEYQKGPRTGPIDASGNPLVFDMSFTLEPKNTGNAGPETVWDMILWTKDHMTIDLYRKTASGTWEKILADTLFNVTPRNPEVGLSLAHTIWKQGGQTTQVYPLQALRAVTENQDYGIVVKSLNGVDKRENFTGTVKMDVLVVAKDESSMTALIEKSLTPTVYDNHQQSNDRVDEIGTPSKKWPLEHTFQDTKPPTFISDTPTIIPSDTGVTINFLLSRTPSHYYYVIAEAGEISTTLTDGTHIGLGDRPSWEKLPESGYGITEPNVSAPVSLAITNPDDSLIHGNDPYPGKMVNLQVLNKLEPLTPYIVYFVLEGESQDSTSAVYAFRFETRKVSRPVLQATLSNPSASVSSLAVPKSVSGATGVKKDADVNYLVINDLKIGDPLNGMMADHWDPTYAEAMNISPGRIAEAKTKYIGYSFLEAMATQFVYNDENYGTVFDLFCSPSTQEMLGGWFNTAQTDGTNIIKVGIGQGSGLQLRTPSWQQKVDCTKELSNASGKYWFVACGQGDGSAYAFTAARYLTNPNEKHPMVNAISFESEAYATREEALAALNQGVSGPLSIAFDNPIYYAYNGNELMQVVDTSPANLLVYDGYYASSLTFKSISPSIKHVPQIKDLSAYPPGSTLPKCSTLSFTVTNAKLGAYIEFDKYLAHENANYGQAGLTIRLDVAQDKNGFWRPMFIIATEGWDATTN